MHITRAIILNIFNIKEATFPGGFPEEEKLASL